MNDYAKSVRDTLAATGLPSEPPDVSVIMVVYRTGEVLFDSIRQVLAEPLVDEFVVIDNGSTAADEARLQGIAELEPRFRLVQGHGNIGFARGCNLGARTAKGKRLIILNPDAYLQPGCVTALIEAGSDRPSPCVVGARVLNPDGTEQRGARRGEVTPVTTLLSFSNVTRLAPLLRGFEIHLEEEALPAEPIEVPTISGACFYMTREDFHRLGGFDERYFLHVEDVDICWRARGMGGCVLFAPEATVVHLGSTSRKHPVVVEYHKGRGLVRYFAKRADNPWRLALAVGLSPLIMLVSVLRPAMRTILPKARNKGPGAPRPAR